MEPQNVPVEKTKKKGKWAAPHDGGNVTHYLGNDDTPGASLPVEKDNFSEEKLMGKVAEGNLELTEEESLSEEDKKIGR